MDPSGVDFPASVCGGRALRGVRAVQGIPRLPRTVAGPYRLFCLPGSYFAPKPAGRSVYRVDLMSTEPIKDIIAAQGPSGCQGDVQCFGSALITPFCQVPFAHQKLLVLLQTKHETGLGFLQYFFKNRIC